MTHDPDPDADERPWTRRVAEALRRRLSPVFNVGGTTAAGHLSRLGVRDRQFIDWARGTGHELEELWVRCPRADWLLELCLAAGLRREMIEEAVELSLDAMRAERLPGFDEPEAAAREALRRWSGGESGAGALLARFSEALVLILDNSHRLRNGRRRTAYKTTVPPMFSGRIRSIGPNADQAFLHGLADKVRDSVPFEELRRAVLERVSDRDGPYR
jgi:hypothetical protein